MRLYTQDEEERIRAQTLVREWTRSKLIDPSQGARLEAELRADLKRTNVFLRAGLALFTLLIVTASVLFVGVGLNLHGDLPIAAVSGVAALVCIGLAEVVVAQLRFYRFGVEEALAIAAVLLLAVSGAVLASTFHIVGPGDVALAAGFLIGAAGGLGVYRRFGLVYAAIGGMVCAAAIPFQLDLSATARHVLAAATFAAVFLVVRPKQLRYRDEYPGDEYGLLQAAAWAGLYIALNLQLSGARMDSFFYGSSYATAAGRIEGFFYWFTYVMTWVLPIVGLSLGIRGKDRPLIDVSLVMALVTLLTNKAYLGWPRHTWDPILLGIFLMAVALVVRRWLSNGPGGRRGAFTPARILSKDHEALTLLTAASMKFQPDVPASRPDPVKSGFDGGRSGGGGASGTY
ncbi:MAG TPA: hypothetical protein VF921_16720 [Vicinamibacterales bacterium]